MEYNHRIMIMRTASCLTILVSVCLLSVRTSAQADSQPTGLSPIVGHISLNKSSFIVGEAVVVKVEVSNKSDGPVVMPNDFSGRGHIEFKLQDEKGRILSPDVRYIGDSFDGTPRQMMAQADFLKSVLRDWLVLYPSYSISTTISVDGKQFSVLNKPGRYKLFATYSASSLTYPANYLVLGLKEQDVSSLPYKSWNGKVQTSSVWITILPRPNEPSK